MENGDHVRTMNTRDGQALKFAIEAGYNVAIVTKGFSAGSGKDLNFLGVPSIYTGLQKKSAFDDYVNKLGLIKSEVLYMEMIYLI
ncbi:MAG: hypothetical protein IPJ13_02495 [Saprospiraceae bacterium]|nr:hypothetical protein [Saprospiraceae bacterium]